MAALLHCGEQRRRPFRSYPPSGRKKKGLGFFHYCATDQHVKRAGLFSPDPFSPRPFNVRKILGSTKPFQSAETAYPWSLVVWKAEDLRIAPVASAKPLAGKRG